ncbi:MAG: hypothetical protein K8S99_06180 [Planctomycetes bacterium]|nr:hypothetical protein [Planctomycetota bacterium]
MNTLCHTLTVLVALALLSAGCSTVSFTQPVGKPDAEAAAKLGGVWLVNESAVLYIKPMADGQVRVAIVDEDKEGFKLTQRIGTVTRVDENKNTCLLHLPAEDPDKAKGLTRVTATLVALTDEKLGVAWIADNDTFKKAVEQKDLPGKVEGSTTYIDADKPALEAYFAKHGRSLFKLDAPLIARRIAEIKADK